LTGHGTTYNFFNDTEGTTDEFVLHGDEDLKPFEEFVPAGATKFFDFSNDTGWVFQGGVVISGGTLNGWGNEGGVIRRGIYDLFVNDSFKMNDTKWTVDVDYIFTSASIPAHIPFAFADSSAVILPVPAPPQPNSIAIIQGDTTRGPGLFNLQILTINTTGQSVSNPLGQGIAVFANVQYFLRFERLSVSRLKLSAFSDSARTIHITGSPITLEPLVNALTNMFFIHSANAPTGGSPRTLTGSIDNLAIFNGQSSENDLILNDDFSTYGTPVSPDFTDDFDTFDWTTSDSTRVRIEDDQGFAFAMSPGSSLSKVAMSLDLGALVNPGPNIISDTGWVVRFKVSNTFIKEAGDATSNLVGFSLTEDDQTTLPDVAQDHITFVTRTSIPSV